MELIGKTMIHYLLRGERNLGIEKAKIVGKKTGTDPIVWIDPSRAIERKAAWAKTFKKSVKVKK